MGSRTTRRRPLPVARRHGQGLLRHPMTGARPRPVQALPPSVSSLRYRPVCCLLPLQALNLRTRTFRSLNLPPLPPETVAFKLYPSPRHPQRSHHCIFTPVARFCFSDVFYSSSFLL